MADIDLRLRYFNGQFLQDQDFTAEQEYHLDRLRRHNRLLHTPGIADGLTVTVSGTSARVSPGTAIDRHGRQIVLTQPFDVAFASFANQTVLVVISYAEEADVDSTVGDAGETRWRERPNVAVISVAGAEPEDLRIRLAKLQIAPNGTVVQHDTSVRMLAGNRMRPEETVERLRLSRQGVTPELWPVLSSGAPGRADLAGALNVTGNAVVNGRDLSADATVNDAHRVRTDNPHFVNAEQVGAITGVGGVLNAGGQVNLLAGNNISIAADNGTNKRITIASATIEGVSNPGGNINFVGQGGISISGNNTTKQVTVSTSLSSLGALPADDYLRRYVSPSIWFNQNSLNLATETLDVGFQPKEVWLAGRTWANLGGVYQGGTVYGFARIGSTSSWQQRGFGPYSYQGSGYLSHYGVVTETGIAFAYLESASSIFAKLKLEISAVTSTGLTLRFTRDHAGYQVPSSFLIEVYLTCIG